MEMMRKANTSIKGKLLLVRSLSQDEDDVQEIIIKKTDNDSPVAPKLTLGQHPVLGKLPLVRIINSFLPYDEFIQVELRRLIDEAKNILLKPNKSISEVAYELGFEYPQYFSRLFKKKTGLSPKEYIDNANVKF